MGFLFCVYFLCFLSEYSRRIPGPFNHGFPRWHNTSLRVYQFENQHYFIFLVQIGPKHNNWKALMSQHQLSFYSPLSSIPGPFPALCVLFVSPTKNVSSPHGCIVMHIKLLTLISVVQLPWLNHTILVSHRTFLLMEK